MADRAQIGSHPACPKCKSVASSRLRREGFLQRWVFPYAGLFPWECGTCRTIFLARGRGQTKRRSVPAELQTVSSSSHDLQR